MVGAAGLLKQIFQDEGEGNVAGLTTDFVEAGGIGVALESLRKVVVDVLITLAEFLAALL